MIETLFEMENRQKEKKHENCVRYKPFHKTKLLFKTTNYRRP